MIRKLQSLSLLIFLLVSPLYALNSTYTHVSAPGVKHTFIAKSAGPWTINVLEIDLRNPTITLETVKANDRLIGREKTSAMVARKNGSGHYVIGAINADFFAATGEPTSNQVANGEIVRGVKSSHSQIAMTKHNKPLIGKLSFAGLVIVKNKRGRPINAVNQGRGRDSLVIYNHFFGTGTGTNPLGAEIEMLPLSNWVVNDTMKFLVNKLRDSVGNMSIPLHGAVLSGHGISRTFITSNIAPGDTVAVLLAFHPGSHDITQLVGGLPCLIKDGIDVSSQSAAEEGALSTFVTTRHPRTALGFSRDSTTVYFVTVDGRQTSSVGMSLPELSDFMISLGVYQGVNLDGGGSTTIVVNGRVVNSPSDAAGERPVANAVLVVSSVPSQVEEGRNNSDDFELDQNQVMFDGSGLVGGVCFYHFFLPTARWRGK